MPKNFLLAIDSGTSVVKAALFDRAGQEIATALQRTAVYAPQPGWSEVNMGETWQAAVTTIQELLRKAEISNQQIAGVGVTGNMIGAWLIDSHGQPVRDAMLWNDGRTRPLIEQFITENPRFLSDVFSFSGSVLEHGCTLPLVRWLADHEAASLQKAQAILHSKDWIRYKLTGEIVTDTSEIPGLPGDARTLDYAEALFEMFGISQYRHLFPPAVPSQTVVGEVQPEAARLTGLNPGTPVIAGTGDVSAVAIGVGAVEPGSACSILGTHSINGLVVDHALFEPADLGILFYMPNGHWLRALANIGTANLDWFIHQVLSSMPQQSSEAIYAEVENLAQQSPVGARGLIYHPYLSSVGMIAPVFEPAARAQFFGITPNHHRADLVRAIYEGVALAIRDCYTAVQTPIQEIRLSGGGARSHLWGQTIADCIGVRVVVPSGSEFGAKGAALLAGIGVGWYPSIAEAVSKTLTIARIHDPDPNHKRIHDANYAIYRELRQVLRPVWQKAATRPNPS